MTRQGQDMTKFIKVQVDKDNLELGYKGINTEEISEFNYVPSKDQMFKIYIYLKNNTKIVGFIKEEDLESLK